MADPAQIEQLLQRTRDFVRRKQADEIAFFAMGRAPFIADIASFKEKL